MDDVRWLSPEETDAWIRTAGLLIRLPSRIDAAMTARCGITFFEYSLLSVLSEQPDRSLQMSEVARATASSLSRLSHVAGRLEKRGLITRTRACGGPGRRTTATLTEAGLSMVEQVAPEHLAIVRELVVDRLEPEEFATFGALAARIAGDVRFGRPGSDGDCGDDDGDGVETGQCGEASAPSTPST